MTSTSRLCKRPKAEQARFDSGHRFTATSSPGVKTESSTYRLSKYRKSDIHMNANEPLFHRYWTAVASLLVAITPRFYADLYEKPADASQMRRK